MNKAKTLRQAQMWRQITNRPKFDPDRFSRYAKELSQAVYELSREMSAIDRIKAKALAARDIAPQAIKDFEADLDGILAEKDALASKRAAAVAPHHEAIAGIYSEFDGLKQAMDMLSNGGPTLDPLPESAPVAPVSLPSKPSVDQNLGARLASTSPPHVMPWFKADSENAGPAKS